MEMWGGIEATIHRLGDTFHEQMERNGHKHRLSDLDLLVELGIKAIRYPVLMEQLAPRSLASIDFSWTDKRLPYLRDNGIRIIAGLLHHGSGSKFTSLLDDNFPEKVAMYASKVAQQYEWLDAYTPINEPLTTARFSGLYGLWYPHETDSRKFIKMLLNQCKAVVLSMRAIREVNPNAQLIQTEDIGYTEYLQKCLNYQAYYENSRRFLTFDFLTGRVNSEHPLWYYLIGCAEEEDLLWFQDNPMPPDIVGINYYVTSERALDSRVELYPDNLIGGNGKDDYVDIELVRVGEMRGFYNIVKQVWERYNLPVAITEAHLNCSIDEQMLWLKEAWDAAKLLESEDVDIRAVTSWALFGSFDWNSLLTRLDGHYENGVFDVSGDKVKKTLLFNMVKSLSTAGKYNHPYLKKIGWWHRPDRLIYPVIRPMYEQL